MTPPDEIIVELASIEDAEEILALQKLAYVSEAEIIDDFTIPPLHQTLANGWRLTCSVAGATSLRSPAHWLAQPPSPADRSAASGASRCWANSRQ
jgi:hypothetical protein